VGQLVTIIWVRGAQSSTDEQLVERELKRIDRADLPFDATLDAEGNTANVMQQQCRRCCPSGIVWRNGFD
jgi:hypothetical protein